MEEDKSYVESGPNERVEVILYPKGEGGGPQKGNHEPSVRRWSPCNGRRITTGNRRWNAVNLEFRAGEVVGLLGPTVAGKTTTFYILVGLIRPEGGKMFLSGEE